MAGTQRALVGVHTGPRKAAVSQKQLDEWDERVQRITARKLEKPRAEDRDFVLNTMAEMIAILAPKPLKDDAVWCILALADLFNRGQDVALGDD